MLFYLVSQVMLLLCRITWSSLSTCKSCHCSEGLTFSDPIQLVDERGIRPDTYIPLTEASTVQYSTLIGRSSSYYIFSSIDSSSRQL
jgi:hypothetical protein